MTEPEIPVPSFSRRLWLQVTAAYCGLRLTGCGIDAVVQTAESKKNGETKNPKSAREFIDQGYRLYGIVPEDEGKFNRDVLPNIAPPPIHISSYQPWRMRPLEETEAATPAFQWMIWALKSDADRVARLSGVKEVIEKQPEHLLESGSPDKAGGKLSVLFVVSPANGIVDDKTAATLAQIEQTLKDAANKFEGVTVKHLPRKELPLNDFGDVPIEQISIEFTTPTLNAEFLKLIKTHPQTLHLKWDGLFTEFYCPPCGMG